MTHNNSETSKKTYLTFHWSEKNAEYAYLLVKIDPYLGTQSWVGNKTWAKKHAAHYKIAMPTKLEPVPVYIPKADLVEYLNGLRIYDVRGSTQNPDNPNYWTNKTKINNQLLDEIIKYVERE